MSGKPFSMQYVHKGTGQKVTERPRLLISVDGREHRLVVGESAEEVTIAKGVRDGPQSEGALWIQARQWVATRAARV